MIFVCANCTSFRPQLAFFYSVCIIYFLYVWDVSTPQLTFYSGIFTAYLCMIFVCAKLPDAATSYLLYSAALKITTNHQPINRQTGFQANHSHFESYDNT